MISLRRRLALASGIAVALLATVSALAIVSSQWSTEKSRIVETAELRSIDQADAAFLRDGEVVLQPVGSADFAIALDGEEIVATVGDVPETVGAIAVDSALSTDSVGDGTVTVDEFEDSGATWATATTDCLDPDACTAMVVGVKAPTWGEALAERWIPVVLAVVVLSLLAAAGAAWLAALALRPVEAMRAELAATTATDLSRRVPVERTGDELESLATTLNETLERLEEAVAANERFVADAAHELRTPLAGMRAAIELRAKGDDLLVDTIGEIDRASALVDDLLLLARGDALAAHREETDLDDLVRREASALSSRDGGLTVSVSAEPVRVRVQRSTMERVVRNLLDNAARHGAGHVDVTLGAQNGRALLAVDDDGPGVPEADRARVFDRFVRLDASRDRASGGSGIGLAIVKEGVEAHHGTVEVGDSALGGARFVVGLPMASDTTG